MAETEPTPDVDALVAGAHPAEVEAHNLRDELRRTRAQLKVARDEVTRLTASLSLLDVPNIEATPWTLEGKPKAHQATALVMLSDLHLDEVVRPEEMHGANAYNREIALLRLRRVAGRVLTIRRDVLGTTHYDGCVLLLGGDLISGDIHEELKETNEATVLETVEFWLDPLASVVATLTETFGRLHVVGVPGNHGRTTRKPRAKMRAQSNFDWLIGRLLAREFASDDRVTWNVPESADAYFEVYGHRHCLTHGDQARGGSGISGLLTPVSLLDHRKRKRDAAIGEPYSHLWMGHWHQYLQMGSVTINGSLKGLDEYAWVSGFGAEPPVQAFALLTPEHNVTIQMPLYALDREAEGW